MSNSTKNIKDCVWKSNPLQSLYIVLPKWMNPFCVTKSLSLEISRNSTDGFYLTLNIKYSFFFRNVGKTAILSHFSFNNPGPLRGPPLMSWNLNNSVLSLKLMNGKYLAGVMLASSPPSGETVCLAPLNLPRILVAFEISMISISNQPSQRWSTCR